MSSHDIERKERPVLLIEDNADIRSLFKLFLQTEGYHVATAENGLKGIDALRALDPAPSVIFLDMNMPVMNGPEFLAKRRELGLSLDIPVVAFAATGTIDGLAGIVEWLRKPVSLEALGKILDKYCG